MFLVYWDHLLGGSDSVIPVHVLVTSRLDVRRARIEDVPFIQGLWTSPEVMRCVGFPEGLAISQDAIRQQIERSSRSVFGALLIAESLETGARMGQCTIGSPDSEGICEPDIKLDPAYWGQGFGHELWQAMIDYAFANSDSNIVQGTPNRANAASVRMQKGSGMIQVDQGVFEPNMRFHPQAIAVPYIKLQITRAQWQVQQERALAHAEGCS
jgi:RimJ/RimL family protein N-acetyltransferase